jgi:hypothetical protein
MKNKVTHYLIYAIGEIILVLVGILIALEINNQNEQRKADDFEIKMLIEIQNALQQDLAFFNDHLIGYRNKTLRKASDFFDRYYLTGEIDRDSINYYFNDLNFGIQITYNRGPYDAVKSTGLDKINNDSLRSALIKAYDFQLPRWEGLISSSQDQLVLKIEELKRKMVKPAGYEIINGEVIHNQSVLKSIKLIDDEDFISLVGTSAYFGDSQLDYLNTFTPYLQELHDKVVEELKRRNVSFNKALEP